MTKDDLLRLILDAADDVGRVFDHAEIARWPSGASDDFAELGLLRAASGDMTAPCPSCAEAHTEPVHVRVESDGRKRFFIRCPESLRVEIDPEMCLGWEIDPDGLAAAVCTAMDLKGSPKPVVPGRLWRLGRIPWKGKTREVLLALRRCDSDTASVSSHVGPGGRSIVLVPHHVPDARIWPGRTPAVVALSRVATLEGSLLVIDGVALADIIVEADRLADALGVVAIDQVGKKMVRQQVKAEIKSLLTDDALIAAYKEYGSYRKAAEALTEQMGQPISKDKVKRAVDRKGGVAAVIPQSDSASVARGVASHPRDRQKKFLERR